MTRESIDKRSCKNCTWRNAWSDTGRCPFRGDMCDRRRLKMWLSDEHKKEGGVE